MKPTAALGRGAEVKPAAALIAGLVTVLLAGCGSSDPSAAQFRQSATGVCRSSTAQTARIAAPRAPAQAVTFLRRGLRVLTPELSQLRGLAAPRALSADYATALGAFSGELRTLRAAVRQLNGGADPVTTTQTLQRQLSPLESRGDRAWNALDLPACASS